MAIPKWKRQPGTGATPPAGQPAGGVDYGQDQVTKSPEPQRRTSKGGYKFRYDIPKGTLISKQFTKQEIIETGFPGFDIARKMTTLPGAIENYMDFWKLLIGTPEEKVDVVGEVYGIGTTSGMPLGQYLGQRFDEPGQQWWSTQNYFTFPGVGSIPFEWPEFKWPDLSGVGKWLLIGGGAIAGIWLLGKIIGRK